jgi:kynurenine formamidase
VNTIEAVKNGLVGRGVLLDLPRLRGVPWLEPGEHIFPEELEAAEREQRVTVEEGDILLVRTGHARRLGEMAPIHALTLNAMGLHLIDYLQFEDLVPACEKAERWEFLFVGAPLRIVGGTGSPLNPIAIF